MITTWTEGTKDGEEIGDFESGATWNERLDAYSFHYYWAAGSEGSFGSGDYIAASYYNTDVDGSAYVEFTSDSLATDLENFINGTHSVLSWAISSNSVTTVVSSTEHSGYEPYILFSYEEASADTPNRRRKMMLQQ